MLNQQPQDDAIIRVDLYEKEDAQEDSSGISENVFEMLKFAFLCQEKELDPEEDIDGGVEDIRTKEDLDMLVVCCYVAEQQTFGFECNWDGDFDFEFHRQRITDYILELLIKYGAYSDLL